MASPSCECHFRPATGCGSVAEGVLSPSAFLTIQQGGNRIASRRRSPASNGPWRSLSAPRRADINPFCEPQASITAYSYDSLTRVGKLTESD